MASETYWQCKRCGDIARPTNMAEDVVGRWYCDMCSHKSEWEPVAVLPLAEAEELRARAKAVAMGPHGEGEIMPSGSVDELMALRRLREAAKRFYGAWVTAESNRGCYSTAEQHDCRCERSMKGGKACSCGRDDLEDAEVALKKAMEGKP